MIKKRKQTYYLNVPIPTVLRPRYGGKAKLESTLQTADARVARAKAQAVASRLKLEALSVKGSPDATAALARKVYDEARAEVLSGKRRLEGVTMPIAGTDREIEVDPTEAAVDAELEEIRERQWARADPADPDPSPVSDPLEDARAAGLADGLREMQGARPAERHRYAPPFRETARDWLDEWKRQPGRKKTNTADQYQASIDAFADWWGERPLRNIAPEDAAAFVSHLSRITAGQARHRRRGGVVPANDAATPGLAVSTIRRYAGTLGAIWKWSKPRLGLTGDNPWQGVAPRKPKRPPAEHMPWTGTELRRLLIENRPKRRDVYEAALVALHTGMRVGEIADMTWGDVAQEEGVWCFHVLDAKTPAGIRSVPIHDALGWLLRKPRGADDEPLWPGFNPEGPGKSRGDDLSRLFGRYKDALGFKTGKTFHGFRKTFTHKAENLGIPSNQWARVIGHEPGFTYGTYNPAGLTPANTAAIINRIRYDGLELPDPSEVYPEEAEASPARPKRRRRVPP
jgi:integrase